MLRQGKVTRSAGGDEAITLEDLLEAYETCSMRVMKST